MAKLRDTQALTSPTAHCQLYALLQQLEERAGQYPKRLRISERTVRVLAVESDQSDSPLINVSRIENIVMYAREGKAQLFGVPIEVTH